MDLVAVLVVLLVAALWCVVSIWRATPSMPLYGNMIMGVARSLGSGGRMRPIALMYCSQRHGYDEPGRSGRMPRE